MSSFEKGSWIVIGVSGATNGGKTTLSSHLLEMFPGSVVLNQDDYFWPENDDHHTWVEVREAKKLHQNWEAVGSVDWLSFERDIKQVLSSSPGSSRLVILDGHILFNHEPFKSLFDLRFFLTLDKDSCFLRRAAREYLPPDPAGYFDQIVWPMYLNNMNHVKQLYGDQLSVITFLDGTEDPHVICNLVTKQINELHQTNE